MCRCEHDINFFDNLCYPQLLHDYYGIVVETPTWTFIYFKKRKYEHSLTDSCRQTFFLLGVCSC